MPPEGFGKWSGKMTVRPPCFKCLKMARIPVSSVGTSVALNFSRASKDIGLYLYFYSVYT